MPPSSNTLTSHFAVVIHIESGSFATGFSVTLEILEDGRSQGKTSLQEDLRIPAAPEMQQKYETWQAQSYEGSRRRQVRLLSEYDLSLTSLDNVSALPTEGRRTVVVARIRDLYYACIFDRAGNRVIANEQFSPDEQLVQQLESEFSNRSADNQTRYRLTEKVVSNFGYTLRGNRLTPVNAQETNVSDVEQLSVWRRRTDELTEYCQTWFRDREFSRLCDRILAVLNIRDKPSVPILLCCQTDNSDWNILQRLPFHLWDLHKRLPKSEFTLSTGYLGHTSPLQRSIKVLAIFGSARGGLELEVDSSSLNFLRQNGAQITRISEPTNTELHTLLSENSFDILFFAGHSSSTGLSGQIVLRGDEPFGIENLSSYLIDAREKGLKLCIFNSCDGLQIATTLRDLGMPNIIAMKEPVPDNIACIFLVEFLKEFAKGTQLSQAVRQARKRLSLEQREVPAASWLPAVWLNPNSPELVLPKPRSLNFLQPILRFALLPSIGILAIIAMFSMNEVKNRFCGAIPNALREFIPLLECPLQIEDILSRGEREVEDTKIELSSFYSPLKNNGIKEFAAGNYQEAINTFDSLRAQARANKASTNPNERAAALTAFQDPTVLIYRNNALARMRSKDDSSPLYTIALAAPLNTDPGHSIALGVAQAQDIAVKEGLNLQVVVANDSNKQAQARQVADVLSRDEDVLAVVGHYTSPNTCAALNIYSPKKLVVVSPASTMVNLPSNPKCGGDPSQVFLRTVSNTRVETETLIQHLVEDLGIVQPKIVVFYNAGELFSRDMYEQFRQVLNSYRGTLLGAFDLSDPSFKENKLPSLVDQADAIALLPDGGTDSPDALIKSIAIAKLNDGDKPILGANTLYTQGAIDDGGEALINSLFIAVDWHPKMCGSEAFAQEIRDYWGGDSNRVTALAYEAVQVIASVLSQTPTPISREDLRLQLYSTGVKEEAAPDSHVFDGKTISFGPNGDREEINTRAIVTVNEQLRFSLVNKSACSPQLSSEASK